MKKPIFIERNLLSRALKLFKDDADVSSVSDAHAVSSSNAFQRLITRSEKKCYLTTVANLCLTSVSE